MEALFKIINPIRMSLRINSFNGVIPDDCQKESIPSTLSTLVSMLINGDYPGKESMSQTIVTISQIAMHQFRKKPSQQSTPYKTSRNSSSTLHWFKTLFHSSIKDSH